TRSGKSSVGNRCSSTCVNAFATCGKVPTGSCTCSPIKRKARSSGSSQPNNSTRVGAILLTPVGAISTRVGAIVDRTGARQEARTNNRQKRRADKDQVRTDVHCVPRVARRLLDRVPRG